MLISEIDNSSALGVALVFGHVFSNAYASKPELGILG